MKKSRILALLLICVFALSACGQKPEEPTTEDGKAKGFTVATLSQIDAWPTYIALVSGESEKFGFDGFTQKDMKTFADGMQVVETMPAKGFDVGDVGGLPALMAALRYDAQIVGVASDESRANAIVARPDSDVFKTPNEKISGAFGTAENVKGKTIMMTAVSSDHHILDKWLSSMGLTEKDVTIQTGEQETTLKAFAAGQGDFLILWAPDLYRAYDKGYKEVVNASQAGANSLMVYIASKEWAEAHSDQLARYLAMTSAMAQRYQTEGVALVPNIKKFFKDYSALDISDEDAKLEIEQHKLFTLYQQLDQVSTGKTEASLNEIAVFFEQQGKITKEELKQLQDKHYNITDKYLKAALNVEVK